MDPTPMLLHKQICDNRDKLIKNVIFKIIAMEKNPFTVLPLYENLQDYSEFKNLILAINSDLEKVKVYLTENKVAYTTHLNFLVPKFKQIQDRVSWVQNKMSECCTSLEDHEQFTYELS